MTTYRDRHAIFNRTGAAAVDQDRRKLARALRSARRVSRDLSERCRYHATMVGWPLRKRPNGTYR